MRVLLALATGVLLSAAAALSISALAVSESEPNNTLGTANPLGAQVACAGSINPAGDLDYYRIKGINATWGFVALLDTTASVPGRRAALTALGADGATVLRTDTGSWARGSGIAFQRYVDNLGSDQYLRVESGTPGQTVSAYTLRFYETVVETQPEVEPNNSRVTATPSSYTHEGTIARGGDVDCFAFHGRAGDTVLMAVDGNPDLHGGPLDAVLELIAPGNTVFWRANVTGAGGSEFLEYQGLPVTGLWAYCVRDGNGRGGPEYDYRAGIIRNGVIYLPPSANTAAWLNPRRAGYARVGDTLTFRLAFTNTGSVAIPGGLSFTAVVSPSCLSFVSAAPAPTSVRSSGIVWEGLASSVAPQQAVAVTINLRAFAACRDEVRFSYSMPYYFTTGGTDAPYNVYQSRFFPVARR